MQQGRGAAFRARPEIISRCRAQTDSTSAGMGVMLAPGAREVEPGARPLDARGGEAVVIDDRCAHRVQRREQFAQRLRDRGRPCVVPAGDHAPARPPAATVRFAPSQYAGAPPAACAGEPTAPLPERTRQGLELRRRRTGYQHRHGGILAAEPVNRLPGISE